MQCLVPVAPDSSSYRVWFFITFALESRGYDPELLITEDDDIPLPERVRRTNAHCQSLGKSNVLLISLHINAAGEGTRWHTATGWSCYTCKGQTQSDTLANCLYQAAIKNFPGKRIRTDYSDNDPDRESPHIKNLNIA